MTAGKIKRVSIPLQSTHHPAAFKSAGNHGWPISPNRHRNGSRVVFAHPRQAGAQRLYLETNHVLTPAIRLYESMGFKHIDPNRIVPSQYASRCVHDVSFGLKAPCRTVPPRECHGLVRLTGYARVEVLVMDWRREMRGEGNGEKGPAENPPPQSNHCTKIKCVRNLLIIN
jgi:hypothetical protein